MQVEICTKCDRRIGLDEQAYVFNNEIVCEECDFKLRSAASTNNKIRGAVRYEDGQPTAMQLAFASQLDLTVPQGSTRKDVAVMIDEELAYRKLISAESDSSHRSPWIVKPRKVAMA
jgi:hypothetical protein